MDARNGEAAPRRLELELVYHVAREPMGPPHSEEIVVASLPVVEGVAGEDRVAGADTKRGLRAPPNRQNRVGLGTEHEPIRVDSLYRRIAGGDRGFATET